MRSHRCFPGHRLPALLAAVLMLRGLTILAADDAKPPVLLEKLATAAVSGGTLNVDLIRGTLEILTADRDGATLELFSTTENDAASSAKNVRLTTDGNTVKLRQGGGEPGTWLYRLTVPKKFKLDLRNIEGRIAVTNIEGNEIGRAHV